jgi:hypothetical protein
MYVFLNVEKKTVSELCAQNYVTDRRIAEIDRNDTRLN